VPHVCVGGGHVGTTMVGHCGSTCICNFPSCFVNWEGGFQDLKVPKSRCETSKLILGTNLGWLGRIGVVPLKPFGDNWGLC
jgi:hypothetical protein